MRPTKISILFIMGILLSLNACIYHHDTTYGKTFVPNQPAAYANAQTALRDLHAGYTDLAQEKVRLALAQAPHDPLVLGTVGYYYEKTGEVAKASQYYLGAVLYNPNSTVARRNYNAFLCRNDLAGCTQKNQFTLGDTEISAYYMAQESNNYGH